MRLKELKVDFTKSNSELRQLGYRTIDGRRFLDFISHYKDELNLGLKRMEEYVVDLDTNEQLTHKKHKVASEPQLRDGLSLQRPEHPSALLTKLILRLEYIYDENVATAIRVITHPEKPSHLILDTLYHIGANTDIESIRYRQVVRFTLQSIKTPEILYQTYLDLKPYHSEKGGFFWRDVSELFAQLPYRQSDITKLPQEEVRYAPISLVEEIIEHPLTCIADVRIQTFEMSEMKPQTITRTENIQIVDHRHFNQMGVQPNLPNHQKVQILKNYINEIKSGKRIVTFRELDGRIARFIIWYVRDLDGQTVVESVKLGIMYSNTHDNWQQIAKNNKWFKHTTRCERHLFTERHAHTPLAIYKKLLRAT